MWLFVIVFFASANGPSVLAAAPTVAVSAGPITAVPPYTITELGTLGGAESRAYGVNEKGQVVGWADTLDGKRRAFLWASGVMTDLGALGGANSTAYAINDVGQVVGQADTPLLNAQHAFLWSNGSMADLKTLGGADSVAYAINKDGQVVGAADTSLPEVQHAALWQSGLITDLNNLLPALTHWRLTQVRAINAQGQIAGIGAYQGTETPFFLDPATGQIEVARDELVADRIIVIDDNAVRLYDRDGNLAGAPISVVETPLNHALVSPFDDRIVVADLQSVRLFDGNGVQMGVTVPISGAADVEVIDRSTLIADDNRMVLLNANGVQPGTSVPTDGRARLGAFGKEAVIADDSSVRLFDLSGIQIGAAISTTAPTFPVDMGKRLVVADDQTVRFFDAAAVQQGSAVTATARALIPLVSRMIVVEDKQVQIVDPDGNVQGSPIPTSEQATVRVSDSRIADESTRLDPGQIRIAVIDKGSVQIVDLDGNRKGGPIATDPLTSQAEVYMLGTRILVVDRSSTRLFDLEGVQKGATNPLQGQALVYPLADRFAVADRQSVKIFDLDGVQHGATLPAQFPIYLIPHKDRFVVIDAKSVRTLDADGTQKGATIATKGAGGATLNHQRLAVTDADAVRFYDLDGVQKGITTTVTAPAFVANAEGRFVVYDAASVRIFDLAGNQLGATLPISGFASVQVFGQRVLVNDTILAKNQVLVRDLDLEGVQKGATIVTSIPTARVFVPVEGRFVVSDKDTVRIFDADGITVGQAISTTGAVGISDVQLGACDTDCHAYALNGAGQVAGFSVLRGKGSQRAFLWRAGVSNDLGTLGGQNSVATGIDGSGQVVGYSHTDAGAINAAIWASGSATNLNDLLPPETGWTALTEARAVNNAGQIAGFGQFNGQTRAFLLSAPPIRVFLPLLRR